MEKPDWIVCGQDQNPLCDKNGRPETFKSEKAAIKKAGGWVSESEDVEAWVYRLSHIVERPTGVAIVTKIK